MGKCGVVRNWTVEPGGREFFREARSVAVKEAMKLSRVWSAVWVREVLGSRERRPCLSPQPPPPLTVDFVSMCMYINVKVGENKTYKL